MPPVRVERRDGDVAELILDAPPLNLFDAAGLDAAGADARTADLTSHLFETRDSREAVKSFLRHGLGKADFTGE